MLISWIFLNERKRKVEREWMVKTVLKRLQFAYAALLQASCVMKRNKYINISYIGA